MESIGRSINSARASLGQLSSELNDHQETYEQHLLADLPQTPWQHTEWKRAKVAPDYHIIVATVRPTS